MFFKKLYFWTCNINCSYKFFNIGNKFICR